MKKIVLMLIVMALASPLVVSAADVVTQTSKNPCLLDSANCASGQSDTIQEIIAKLQTEVNKGPTVYSVQELEKLEAKLSESQTYLTNLTTP